MDSRRALYTDRSKPDQTLLTRGTVDSDASASEAAALLSESTVVGYGDDVSHIVVSSCTISLLLKLDTTQLGKSVDRLTDCSASVSAEATLSLSV